MTEPGIVLLVVGDKGFWFAQDLGARVHVSTVVSYKQKGSVGPGVADFKALASALQCTFVESHRPDQALIASADLVFAVGWQYLLPAPTKNVVVFHDSLLPKFRGFAPTVAALIAGEERIGVTALLPVEAPDSGAVLAQEGVDIQHPMRVADAFQAIRGCYLSTALDVIALWRSGPFVGYEQDESAATYSIWRDEIDLRINWEDSADRILRFICAVGHPYGGARAFLGPTEVVVEDAEVLDDLPFTERHPGKVWRLDSAGPVVVCATGLVRLTRLRHLNGEPARVARLRSRFSDHPTA